MIEPFLPFDVRGAIVLHMNEFPDTEIVGVIELNEGVYEYVRCENVHPDSGTIGDDGQLIDVFRFDPVTSARVLDKGSNIVAYVHSHPNGPYFPSRKDQELQIMVGKPSVIAAKEKRTGVIEVFSFGDHLLDVELMNRIFKHAVFDCWEAIRSWKWQNEQEYLDPFPREDRWWEVGAHGNGHLDPEFGNVNENMYEANFASQNYAEFIPDFHDLTSSLHPRVGDVILMQLDSPVINHAAVYVGNNQIYHHRMNKKSGTNALGYLLDNGYVRKWLRRVEA